MTHKEIAELLKTVSDEQLLPIESVVIVTIADIYQQLRNVPMGELNELIDIERVSRGLPTIPWRERGIETFLADMAYLSRKV